MSQNENHQKETAYWCDVLQLRLPEATVCSDLPVHYRRGDGNRAIVPDLLVALRAPARGDRTSYKLWENPLPDLAMEMLSPGNWQEDDGPKRRTYEHLGVREYWLFDPGGRHLPAQLVGYRLHGKRYRRIGPNAAGRLPSEVLGLELHVRDDRLRFRDPATGQDLLTHAEEMAGRAVAEAGRKWRPSKGLMQPKRAEPLPSRGLAPPNDARLPNALPEKRPSASWPVCGGRRARSRFTPSGRASRSSARGLGCVRLDDPQGVVGTPSVSIAGKRRLRVATGTRLIAELPRSRRCSCRPCPSRTPCVGRTRWRTRTVAETHRRCRAGRPVGLCGRSPRPFRTFAGPTPPRYSHCSASQQDSPVAHIAATSDHRGEHQPLRHLVARPCSAGCSRPSGASPSPACCPQRRRRLAAFGSRRSRGRSSSSSCGRIVSANRIPRHRLVRVVQMAFTSSGSTAYSGTKNLPVRVSSSAEVFRRSCRMADKATPSAVALLPEAPMTPASISVAILAHSRW